jgi:glycosyltransferase 2 family protein
LIARLTRPVRQAYQRYRGRPLSLLFTLASLSITLGLLGYLIYRQRDLLISYRWQIRPGALLLAILFYFLGVLYASFLWGMILNHLHGRISFIRHFRNFCLSNLAKRIPGTVWYVAGRAALYSQDGVDAKLTSTASAMELALIQMSGVIISLLFSLSILARYQVPIWVMLLAFLGALALIQPRVISWFLRKLKVEASAFRFQDILRWTLAYLLLWPLGASVLFETANMIYPVPINLFGYFLGCWALIALLSLLVFFLPSNLGVTELGLSLLLARVIPPPVAIATAILGRVLMTLLDIVFAAVWIVISERSKALHPPITQKD